MEMLIYLLQEEGAKPGGGYQTLLMFGLIIVFFYLFFIRQQKKKNKYMRKMRETLKKGDKIISIGGIHGKISEVKEKTIIIELIDKTRMELEKSAVAGDATAGREEIERRK